MSWAAPLLDLLEDRLEQRLLAAEVVVERALGDPGAGDDLVEAGAGVARSVNRSVATSTRARRVEAEYSWRREVPGTLRSAPLATPLGTLAVIASIGPRSAGVTGRRTAGCIPEYVTYSQYVPTVCEERSRP